MEKREALEIISMIANGLDPYNEKQSVRNLPEDNPVTIRALCIALASLLASDNNKAGTPQSQPMNLTDLAASVNGPLESFILRKEKAAIINALDETDYNETEAARMLGISIQALGDRLKVHDISSIIGARSYFMEFASLSIDQFLSEIEKSAILEAIEETNNSKTKAAELLGMSVRSLRYRIERHGYDKIYEQNRAGNNIKFEYFAYYRNIPLEKFLKDVEIEIILKALKKTSSRKEAADLLGITPRSLRYRIETQGILFFRDSHRLSSRAKNKLSSQTRKAV